MFFQFLWLLRGASWVVTWLLKGSPWAEKSPAAVCCWSHSKSSIFHPTSKMSKKIWLQITNLGTLKSKYKMIDTFIVYENHKNMNINKVGGRVKKRKERRNISFSYPYQCFPHVFVVALFFWMLLSLSVNSHSNIFRNKVIYYISHITYIPMLSHVHSQS